ncbi:hypothetical protein R3I93_017222 [Phoxinus phoxinus]|uniref:Uncharacterized protein n=1 Tax=Phoxinus phoxinus TaxID=58324 RepID=A0AAN9CIT6_9TELE
MSLQEVCLCDAVVVFEQGHMVLACGSSGFSHHFGTNFTSVDSYVLLPFLYIQTPREEQRKSQRSLYYPYCSNMKNTVWMGKQVMLL